MVLWPFCTEVRPSEFHCSVMEVTVNHIEDMQTLATVKAKHTENAHSFHICLFTNGIYSDYTADIRPVHIMATFSGSLFNPIFPSCFATLSEQHPIHTECSPCSLPH